MIGSWTLTYTVSPLGAHRDRILRRSVKDLHDPSGTRVDTGEDRNGSGRLYTLDGEVLGRGSSVSDLFAYQLLHFIRGTRRFRGKVLSLVVSTGETRPMTPPHRASGGPHPGLPFCPASSPPEGRDSELPRWPPEEDSPRNRDRATPQRLSPLQSRDGKRVGPELKGGGRGSDGSPVARPHPSRTPASVAPDDPPPRPARPLPPFLPARTDAKTSFVRVEQETAGVTTRTGPGLWTTSSQGPVSSGAPLGGGLGPLERGGRTPSVFGSSRTATGPGRRGAREIPSRNPA